MSSPASIPDLDASDDRAIGAPALPRVLAVDDELPVLLSLRRSLRGQFDVHTALDAERALAMLEEGPAFAALMADMHMPGADGVWLLSEARKRAPLTQRIMLTGDHERTTVLGAINEANVHRFLQKPCTADIIRAALYEAVSAHEEAARAAHLEASAPVAAISVMLQRFAGGDEEMRLPGLKMTRLEAIAEALGHLVGGWAAACGVRLEVLCDLPEAEILVDPDQIVVALAALAGRTLNRARRGARVTLLIEAHPEETGWAAYILEPRSERESIAVLEGSIMADPDFQAARRIVEMHGGTLVMQHSSRATLTRIGVRRAASRDFAA